MNKLYVGRRVAQQIGVPYRTLMYWVETGLLHPEGYSGRKRTPVRFSEKDLAEAGRLVALRRYLSGQNLRDALGHLRSLGHNPLSTGKFVVIEQRDGTRAFFKVIRSGEEAISLGRRQPRSQRLLFQRTERELLAAVRAGRCRILYTCDTQR